MFPKLTCQTEITLPLCEPEAGCVLRSRATVCEPIEHFQDRELVEPVRGHRSVTIKETADCLWIDVIDFNGPGTVGESVQLECPVFVAHAERLLIKDELLDGIGDLHATHPSPRLPTSRRACISPTR